MNCCKKRQRKLLVIILKPSAMKLQHPLNSETNETGKRLRVDVDHGAQQKHDCNQEDNVAAFETTERPTERDASITNEARIGDCSGIEGDSVGCLINGESSKRSSEMSYGREDEIRNGGSTEIRTNDGRGGGVEGGGSEEDDGYLRCSE